MKYIIIYHYYINVVAEELKKKWKNIRDNYTREVNETRREGASGSEAPRKNRKTYAYAEILNFLHPVVKKKKVSIKYYICMVEVTKK